MGIFGSLFLGPPHPIPDHLPLSPGLVASDKESGAHILNRKDGGNLLAIIVGGSQEALNARPGAYMLLLRKRKGFIRLALMHGYLGGGLSAQMEIGQDCILAARERILFWLGDSQSPHSNYMLVTDVLSYAQIFRKDSRREAW